MIFWPARGSVLAALVTPLTATGVGGGTLAALSPLAVLVPPAGRCAAMSWKPR